MTSNQSTNPQKLTESGLARKLDVSRQAIHDLVKRNILQKDADGLIDVEKAEIELLKKVRPSSKTGAAMTGHPMSELPKNSDQNNKIDENLETTNFHVFRTIVEANKAKVGTIELAMLQRTSFSKNDIEESIGKALHQLRETLLQIPARMGSHLSAEQQIILHKEIHAALTDAGDSVKNFLCEKPN